ncbi:MAG: preprotein translocase subunit YajC [Gammaproteobacteria bacterium]|nr:MAG: preprotein translocase subunit YajC [Gammaproteobacteria bacterium]
MDFLISSAWAEGAQAASQGGFGQIFLLIGLFAVFYFLLIRPQQKKAKEHNKMVTALARGDEVITNGGVLGKIVKIGETFMDLEIAEGVTIKVQRHMISQLMPKGTLKSS